MPLKFYTIVVDCQDIAAQGQWWADVLGWRIDYQDASEVSIVPAEAEDRDFSLAEWHSVPLGLVFVPVPEGRTVKNRLHIDLAPHADEDRDEYLRDLEAKGARRVDVGQADATWEVFADPEGNEFCVLSSRRQ